MPLEILRIGLSYGLARFKFRPREDTLEEFFINRFGDRLYRTFFKDYTEKVWGVPCEDISAEWGVQRIKGLSITKAIAHAVASSLRSSAGSDTAQKRTETSLIERFLYPKFGPGQMWEEVARQVALRGGEIHLGHRVVGIERQGVSYNRDAPYWMKPPGRFGAFLAMISCRRFLSANSMHC